MKSRVHEHRPGRGVLEQEGHDRHVDHVLGGNADADRLQRRRGTLRTLEPADRPLHRRAQQRAQRDGCPLLAARQGQLGRTRLRAPRITHEEEYASSVKHPAVTTQHSV